MGSIDTEHDFEHLRDVLGNLPMVKTYTVICLCFPLNSSVTVDQISAHLRASLDRLSATFPYLTGGVFFEGKGDGNTGTSKIVHLDNSIRLVIKDLRDDPSIPSMADLSKAKYPSSMLEGDILSPCPGIPASFEESETNPAPVLAVQANYIKDGLLLVFAGNHVTMDMNALGQLVCLFSKACREEPFTEQEIKQGNRSRTDAIQLLGDDYQPGPELDDTWARPQKANEGVATSVPRWADFNFSPSSLEKLKVEASEQSVVPYISTDDAITAFTWQRVAKARIPRFGSQVPTYLGRAVNAREHVGLDKCYLGHMVDCVSEQEREVWTRPLGEIAGRLRRLVQASKSGLHVRALATMLHRTPDKSKFVYLAHLDLDRDLMLSSWSQVPCCRLGFGELLGVPDAARRPKMGAFGSLVYLMPKSKDGSIAMTMCLREDDLSRLLEGELFTRYAEYLG